MRSRRQRGRLHLWINLTSNGRPPKSEYVMAADVSQGTGASNSVLSVVNTRTKEKVAEFADPHIRPDELARYAVAVARWFYDAFLIWEANGPGRTFGDEVLRCGYRNIYWREKDERKISREKTSIPGFYTTPESKNSFLGAYRRALADGEFINRSKAALKECLEYIFLPNGQVAHSASTRDEDPSGARESHGDRVVADALAYKVCDRGYRKEEPKREVLPGSLMYRRMERFKREREKAGVW